MNIKAQAPTFTCGCMNDPKWFAEKGADLAVEEGARNLAYGVRGIAPGESPWCGAGATVLGARALGRYLELVEHQAKLEVAELGDIDGSVKGPLTEAQWAELIEHVRFGYDQAIAERQASSPGRRK